uniref:Endoribonuclease Dicer 2 n=1 Tax=Anthurium amnicola TaxID=1678845 RepID=A0A1D1Z5R2_9ARAE
MLIVVFHFNFLQIHMAREFQFFILSILIHQNFNKGQDTIHCSYSKDASSAVTYLILPSILCKQKFCINWDCVASPKTWNCSLGGSCHQIQMKNAAICSCVVENSLVYTPHNGYVYCITSISDKYNGNSHMAKRSGESLTYMEYYKSRHGISLMWPNESFLIGRHLFKMQNFLIRRQFREEKESSTAGVELPPELCVVMLSPVTISTLYSYTFVPSVLWRIESTLLAAGLKKSHLDHCMQNVIPATKVLEALTTKKCREQFSLESLETLGDSFLKYAASLHLFEGNKHHHEGLLTHKKEKMISNAALYRLGCSHQIPGFILNEAFDPTNWIIPGAGFDFFSNGQIFYSPSRTMYNRGERSMKGKTVADSVEALLGAYLSSGGEKTALYFLKWLGVTLTFNEKVLDDVAFVSKPEMYIDIKFLESLLQYSFTNPSLLVEALTHGSYQIADIPRCYQRLEFLGDAVLDHLITVHLYNTYPNLSPGLLTDLRSASVNNDCYAHAAVKAELNKHILHASSELHKQMEFYLRNFKQSFSGTSFGWQAGSALPKVLGDVIESIAGAIFVDSGFNKGTVWKSIRPLLEPLVTPETMEYHPVRELEELCARKAYHKNYSITYEDCIASITVEVEVAGDIVTAKRTARNRKTAKQLAARAVLESLKHIAQF